MSDQDALNSAAEQIAELRRMFELLRIKAPRTLAQATVNQEYVMSMFDEFMGIVGGALREMTERPPAVSPAGGRQENGT